MSMRPLCCMYTTSCAAVLSMLLWSVCASLELCYGAVPVQVPDLQRRLDSASHEAAELRVLLRVHKAKVKEQMQRMVQQTKLLR